MLAGKSLIFSQSAAVFSATSSDSTFSGRPVDQAVTRIWQARSRVQISSNGLADGAGGHQHPVVAHQQAAFIRQQPRQPRPLGDGIRHPAVQRIDRHALKVARGVWSTGRICGSSRQATLVA
ncbi:Uncharacterised protein [Raoultella terrigena]|uniref:Uncharacterized protein n=1 Tax=Raoultella terrigena TaxID=577 RepID=A0A3P8KJV4_RAOTE|nr:Uncharacterised protein [Raoultella terrigena]